MNKINKTLQDRLREYLSERNQQFALAEILDRLEELEKHFKKWNERIVEEFDD